MSIFLDLEAGVDPAHDIESSSDNESSFIDDEEENSSSDDAADSGLVALSTANFPQEDDQIWSNLLERAKARGNVGESTLIGEVGYDSRLLDDAPKLWVLSCYPGWEDIVLFHIGRCARPEHMIKAAFIMPHLDKQVWLEAEMSWALKAWLVDIPGVSRRNQQVKLRAVTPLQSLRALRSVSSRPPLVEGTWVKIRRSQFKGEVGMVSKVYPWGCKVLLVPTLDADALQKSKHERQRVQGSYFGPRLFNHMDSGASIIGESRYRFRGFVYEHDLFAHRFSFSQMAISSEIGNEIVAIFGQSRHPQVRKHIRGHPRVSEWCFQVGEKVTQVGMNRSGSIHTVREDGLDVQFAEGLFFVQWADVRKEFKVGQYVQITEGAPSDRCGGWIQAFEGSLLQLISGSNSHDVGIRTVHPNIAIVDIPPIGGTSFEASTVHFSNPTSTPAVPWKRTKVLVTEPKNSWRGKTGNVIDVNIMTDAKYTRPILQILVQLDHYDANTPFPSRWFPYLEVVEAESWLPLNEAQPIKDTDTFFSSWVPHTNVLQEKGRRIPPQHIEEEEPGNATPRPDPSERYLSPAWDPSSPDPVHWCLDPRLFGMKFRVQYDRRQIEATVKRGYDGTINCVRDTLLKEILDPTKVLPIHPRVRHYDMFLVISGEHRGKYVRAIQFTKRSPGDKSDLDWNLAVVIPRAPFLEDEVTDERIVLRSSMMTLAAETDDSKQLNLSVKKRLRQPARDY